MPELIHSDINNDSRIRQYRSRIILSGTGVIILTVWDLLKILFSLLTDSGVKDYLKDGLSGEKTVLAKWVLLISVSILFSVIVFLHAYLGISAISYGRDTGKGWGFLLLALILGIVTLCTIPEYFDISSEYNLEHSGLAALLLDLTFCLILFDMIYSAVRIHLLEKKNGTEHA